MGGAAFGGNTLARAAHTTVGQAMTDPAADLLCGAKRIGHYLGISPYQAWCWLEAGKLPGFKMGGMWYMRPSTYLRQVELAEFKQQARAAGKMV